MNAVIPITAAVRECESNIASRQWYAQLALVYAATSRGVRLVRSDHKGPLYVQKPFYPEGPALPHTYILHPPGGIVSGDSLTIDIDIKADAAALFTTPGAGRVYKARADKRLQTQQVTISVGEGASVEWLPLETIVFPYAYGRLSTRINLAANSRFIGWDVCCLGLPASEQKFSEGSLAQRFEIYRNDTPVLIDRLQLTASDTDFLTGAAGLADHSVSAFMVAGCFAAAPESLITWLRENINVSSGLFGLSYVNEFLVMRYLGHSAEQARSLFTACWQHIRPVLLQREACSPRIWLC